jgi:hypothetical protein
MPGTYKIGRPQWRSNIRIYVEVKSPLGATATVRYDYIRPFKRPYSIREDKVVKTDQDIGKTLKDFGISGAAVAKIQREALKHCRRLAAATKKRHEEQEELKELRAKAKRKKPKPKKKTVNEEPEQKSLF